MSTQWKKVNNSEDKRRNPNWDLLPPRPERETIAFNGFVNDAERNIANRSPRLLQNQWNKLSDMNKRRYETVADEQYKRDMEEWEKKKAALKRPPGAFVLFMMDLWAEEKAKGKRIPLGKMSTKARISWNRATQRKKGIYISKAREMLTQYNAFYAGFRSGKADH